MPLGFSSPWWPGDGGERRPPRLAGRCRGRPASARLLDAGHLGPGARRLVGGAAASRRHRAGGSRIRPPGSSPKRLGLLDEEGKTAELSCRSTSPSRWAGRPPGRQGLESEVVQLAPSSTRVGHPLEFDRRRSVPPLRVRVSGGPNRWQSKRSRTPAAPPRLGSFSHLGPNFAPRPQPGSSDRSKIRIAATSQEGSVYIRIRYPSNSNVASQSSFSACQKPVSNASVHVADRSRQLVRPRPVSGASVARPAATPPLPPDPNELGYAKSRTESWLSGSTCRNSADQIGIGLGSQQGRRCLLDSRLCSGAGGDQVAVTWVLRGPRSDSIRNSTWASQGVLDRTTLSTSAMMVDTSEVDADDAHTHGGQQAEASRPRAPGSSSNRNLVAASKGQTAPRPPGPPASTSSFPAPIHLALVASSARPARRGRRARRPNPVAAARHPAVGHSRGRRVICPPRFAGALAVPFHHGSVSRHQSPSRADPRLHVHQSLWGLCWGHGTMTRPSPR